MESVSDCVRGMAAASVQCTSNPRIVSRSKLYHTYLTMYVLLKIRNVKLDLCWMCCKLFVYSRIPTVVVAVLVVRRGGENCSGRHIRPPSLTPPSPLIPQRPDPYPCTSTRRLWKPMNPLIWRKKHCGC